MKKVYHLGQLCQVSVPILLENLALQLLSLRDLKKQSLSMFHPVQSFLSRQPESKGRTMENGSTSAILESSLAPVPNICGATC